MSLLESELEKRSVTVHRGVVPVRATHGESQFVCVRSALWLTVV